MNSFSLYLTLEILKQHCAAQSRYRLELLPKLLPCRLLSLRSCLFLFCLTSLSRHWSGSPYVCKNACLLSLSRPPLQESCMWIVGHTHTLPSTYLYHCSPSLSAPTEEPATCLCHPKDWSGRSMERLEPVRVTLSFFVRVTFSVYVRMTLSFLVRVTFSVSVRVTLSVYVPVTLSVYVRVTPSVCVQVTLSVYVRVTLSVYVRVTHSVYVRVTHSVYVRVIISYLFSLCTSDLFSLCTINPFSLCTSDPFSLYTSDLFSLCTSNLFNLCYSHSAVSRDRLKVVR